MNIDNKIYELVNLIQGYLSDEVSAESLNEFSWEIIDYFRKINSNDMLKNCELEREFWHALWQIQHLAGEGEESLFRKEMTELLRYLTGEVAMPEQFEGRRP